MQIIKRKDTYIHNNPERHKNSKLSWLNAYYPMQEPCCYLPGDVYYSEKAIEKIVNTEVKDTMFFCVRDTQDGRPLGVNIKGREPLAYKVNNQQVFRQAINELFEMIDKGMFKSDPISWNLYRRINKLPLDYNGYGNDIFHTKGDYIAIDDYTTDIDSLKDIDKLENMLKGGIKVIKVQVTEQFHLGKFNELRNIVRFNPNKKNDGDLYVGDTFECEPKMAEYLTEKNPLKRAFVKIIEVIPEEVKETKVEKVEVIEKPVEEVKPKRRRRKFEE